MAEAKSLPEKPLVAETEVALKRPDAVLARLREHFVEHGEVEATAGGCAVLGSFGRLEIEVAGAALKARASCPDRTMLVMVKSSFVEHLIEMAGQELPPLHWSGDGGGITDIPYFRAMRVVGSRDVTTGMRRVTLSCDDVGYFETGGLHVRVLIPPAGREPVWPSLGPDGRIVWPKGEDELVRRVYSVRRIDRARGEIAIDVVLHGDSPGSVWACNACAGDAVGLLGPGGGEIVPADWYLLAGDETALPPIARLLEGLPATARATVLLEVADASQEQPIESAAALDLTWLHRGAAEPGTSDLLEKAVRALDWPDSEAPYVMIGCEHRTARALRSHIRKERGVARDRHVVVGYWRRGKAAEEASDED